MKAIPEFMISSKVYLLKLLLFYLENLEKIENDYQNILRKKIKSYYQQTIIKN
jgi:hypothetical protein